MDKAEAGSIRRIALLGNHVPRQCGIATFTADLTDAISAEFPEIDCSVLAMDDLGHKHAYPERVRFALDESDIASYRRAADFLNVGAFDVVCLQHEYGIFGGKAGSHILALLRELRMPVVTTLHTLLAEPDPGQRAVMDEIMRLSQRIVVMSARGAEIARRVHGVAEAKIDQIPHGIPQLPLERDSKERLGVECRRVILTFGLLSPDKGIEHVIDAMPAILERCPDAVYIVLGATHPHVKERQGETYRLMLETRAQRLRVDGSMIFQNRFVSQAELTEFLSAADVYVTPYLKREQSTSGTLAYAVGAGAAVVSTPYWYAEELLADGRGVLVPWRDPQALGREIADLLQDDARRIAMRGRARAFGKSMVWPAVARGYVQSFAQARAESIDGRRTIYRRSVPPKRPMELPELDLRHLRLMTDDTGLLQHSMFGVPRYDDGYCLDDNARALLLMALIEGARVEDRQAVRTLATRYLAFVSHAYNADQHRFRNFMAYSRRWTENQGSEDSHGRALWALGTVVGRSEDPGRQSLGGHLFHAALPAVSSFTSPRAWAFTLLGIHEYLRAFEGDSSVQSMRTQLADRLLDLFRRASRPDWPWFEDRLTYSNARLSQALLVSGAAIGREEATAAALRSLDWLVGVQRSDAGDFAPVGSNGFYSRDGTKAAFDQQPVEAACMISACLEARRITSDERWDGHARRAFSWFLGQNHLQQSLYDATTGGCRDGLHADRVNENQGAESTLSFLIGLLEMRGADESSKVP